MPDYLNEIISILNNPFWQFEVFSNSIFLYISALVAFVFLYGFFIVFQKVLISRLEKIAESTKTQIDNLAVSIIRLIRPSLYRFLAFYLALKILSIPDVLTQALDAILIIWLVFIAVKAAQKIIDFVVSFWSSSETEQDAKTAIQGINYLAQVLLWTIAVLLILSNLGINITSLIAGLGIGGVAIALALQKILGDLFSSFAIYFDKPFRVGDFIIVGEHMGVVERIGIKTTRLRALQGEEIVISNQELTSTRVQNFKKMHERRAVFSIGVTYDTPVDKMNKIPDIINKIITETDNVRFDRAHFHEFGDFALIFEIVYYVKSGAYNDYMDSKQKILLGIKEIFAQEGIEFAYPTQTLYIPNLSKK